MNTRDLVVWLADEFHDWIDGDDPVEDYHTVGNNRVWVLFESGAQFMIMVEEHFE